MISYMKTENSVDLLTQEEHDRELTAKWGPEDHEANRALTLAFEERTQRLALANAVKRGRSSLQISQRALAKLVGISTRDVCHIEQGKANPTLTTQVKLLSALGLTLAIEAK
jgi:DNA-binding XRE family transcriptional regulator